MVRIRLWFYGGHDDDARNKNKVSTATSPPCPHGCQIVALLECTIWLCVHVIKVVFMSRVWYHGFISDQQGSASFGFIVELVRLGTLDHYARILDDYHIFSSSKVCTRKTTLVVHYDKNLRVKGWLALIYGPWPLCKENIDAHTNQTTNSYNYYNMWGEDLSRTRVSQLSFLVDGMKHVSTFILV
jgi:hypothetical protein